MNLPQLIPHTDAVAPFTSSKADHGWLGNMSRYKVMHEDREYETAEHLFQCMRFDSPAIIAQIRKENNPYKAKLIAKANAQYMVVEQLSEQDIANMRTVLFRKLNSNKDILEPLAIELHGKYIVEDVSKRLGGSSLFWGATLVSNYWCGANVLGHLWMDVITKYLQNDIFFASNGH